MAILALGAYKAGKHLGGRRKLTCPGCICTDGLGEVRDDLLHAKVAEYRADILEPFRMRK